MIFPIRKQETKHLKILCDIVFLVILLFSIISISLPLLLSKISPYSSLGLETLIIGEQMSLSSSVEDRVLIKDNVITESFVASDSKLGIVLVRFDTFHRINEGTLRFRIKQIDASNWYFDHEYTVDQFQPDAYFTFGFPPIEDAKGQTFQIELSSSQESFSNAVAISLIKPQLAIAYKIQSGKFVRDIPYTLRVIYQKLLYIVRHVSQQEMEVLLKILIGYLLFRTIVTTSSQQIHQLLMSLPAIPLLIFSRIKKTAKAFFKKIKDKKKNRLQTMSVSEKRKLAVITVAILVLVSLFVRYSNYLDFTDKPGRLELYTRTLGGGTDPDSEIMCAVEVARLGVSRCMLIGVDDIFIAPFMAGLFRTFGFVRGLEFIAFTTILIGAFITIFPFLFFSYSSRRISIGGFVVAMLILVNSFMITNSSGRILKYNTSLFSFTLFLVVYFMATKRRTARWLVATGLMAALDALNKPFHFFNNAPLLFLYPFILNAEAIRFSKSFPFLIIGKQGFYKNKLFWKGLLPFIVFIMIITGYHVYYFLKFNDLWSIYATFVNNIWSDQSQVLGATIAYSGNIFSKFKNSVFSLLNGTKMLLEYAHIPVIIYFALLILVLYRRYKKQFVFKVGFTLLVLSFASYALVRIPFMNNKIFPAVNQFSCLDFFSIYTLFYLLFFISMQSRLFLSIVSMQLFYLVALSLSLGSTHQYQLFATLVFWVMVCVGYAIDNVLESDDIKDVLSRYFYYKERTIIHVMMITIAIVLSPTLFLRIYHAVYYNVQAHREYEYLRWVGRTLPADGIIVGGKEDNLVWISELTQKDLLYSAVFSPVYIKENMGLQDVKRTNDYFLEILKNKATDDKHSSKIFFLDNDIDYWLTPSWRWDKPLGKDVIAIEEYVTNDNTNRTIYVMTLSRKD